MEPRASRSKNKRLQHSPKKSTKSRRSKSSAKKNTNSGSPNKKITSYFSPSPRKAPLSSTHFTNESRQSFDVKQDQSSKRSHSKDKENQKRKNKEENQKRKDKEEQVHSITYKKYGIHMPSYEDILRERQNYEDYKEKVKYLTELAIPLPDVKKFDLELDHIRSNVFDCKSMLDEEIKSAFKNNLTYLENIYLGNTYCKRHDMYKKATFMNNLTYNTSMILFTNGQKQLLVKLLTKTFGNSVKLSDYYFKVLLPELCLKIFMDEYSMTYEEATEYLDQYPVDV